MSKSIQPWLLTSARLQELRKAATVSKVHKDVLPRIFSTHSMSLERKSFSGNLGRRILAAPSRFYPREHEAIIVQRS